MLTAPDRARCLTVTTIDRPRRLTLTMLRFIDKSFACFFVLAVDVPTVTPAAPTGDGTAGAITTAVGALAESAPSTVFVAVTEKMIVDPTSAGWSV